MRRLIAGALAVLMTASPALADAIEERPDLAKLFQQQGVPGTFVLFDVAADRLIATDAERAQQAFVPASTFKVANTLIAFETGVVRDENEIVPYGGQPQRVRAWEKDMTLREALKTSNFAIYQEVARRVGVPRMQAMLDRLDYGNRRIGDVIDRFWVDGPLEITAVEQVRFLARLAHGKLPVGERSQALTRELMRLEHRGDTTLYGKTGWYAGSSPQLGWWVGWIERSSAVHAFALNIDMKSDKDAPKRETLGRALLARLGVY